MSAFIAAASATCAPKRLAAFSFDSMSAVSADGSWGIPIVSRKAAGTHFQEVTHG